VNINEDRSNLFLQYRENEKKNELITESKNLFKHKQSSVTITDNSKISMPIEKLDELIV
jgi:hypothetical protein